MSTVERQWTGAVESIRTALELAEQRGQLVHVRPVSARAGRLTVRVVLRAPVARPAPTSRATTTGAARSPRRKMLVVGASVAAATLATLVWLAAQALAWAVEHAAAIAGGVAVGLLVLAAVARVRGGGSGHCPGPWHR